MEKIRIAHVIASVSPLSGGPSYAIVGMTRALARRGHDVRLLTTDRQGGAPIEKELVADHVRFNVSKEIWPAFAWSPGLARELKSVIPKVDIVHIHGLYLHCTIAAAAACRRAGVPYVVRPAGTFDPYHVGRKRFKKAIFNRLVHDRAMRHVAAFHFTTDVEQEISQPYIFGRPSFVVPNGLDVTQQPRSSDARSLRARFPEIGDRKIILFLGRLNYKKGFEVLIPAIADLVQKRDDLHLVIAGNDDGHLETIKRLITDNRVFERTTLAGFLGGQDKLNAFADSYVFVLPSYSENFANALFEALIAGVPAIVSNKVNSWPEVEAGGAGLIIEPEVDALSKAIDALLSNPSERNAMGARASRFARENYSWDSVAEKLEGNYAQIISEHSRR